MFDDREHTLVIVDDPVDGEAGGVQLEAAALTSNFGRFDRAVKTTTAEVREVLAELRAADTLIFVQRAGYLSSTYQQTVTKWLDAGATVVEKNVFAKASRFRPDHPRYIMLLMSADGLARYSLRSLASPGTAFKAKCRVMGNPAVHVWSAAPVDRSDIPSVAGQGITLLRIGRPDPIKWSTFEESFARSLAASWEGLVTLRRIGHPEAPRLQRNGNLTIHDVPYGVDLAVEYSSCDLYIHHSAIGESFGNTIAEAVRANRPVVLGVDWAWDSASIELLTATRHVYGTPSRLVRDSATITSMLRGASWDERTRPMESLVSPFLRPETFANELFQLLQAPETKLAMPMRPHSAIRHLASQAKGGWRGRPVDVTTGVARELWRAARDRRVRED